MNNEVELVLVGDNNDFVDPLDLGIEYDDVNDEVKLQLDDDIEDEPEFHIDQDINDVTPIDPNVYCDPATSAKTSKWSNIKRERSNSYDSIDYDVRYDDTDSDDYFDDSVDSKWDMKHTLQPKEEKQPIKKSALDSVITKTEANKTASPAKWVDDEVSEVDSEDSREDRHIRKRAKKAPRKATTATKQSKAKKNVNKEKKEPKIKEEPTEPRVYKHKKDYRKLLQKYEEMVSGLCAIEWNDFMT